MNCIDVKLESSPTGTAVRDSNLVDRWMSLRSTLGITIGGTLLTILAILVLDAPLNKSISPENLPGEIRRAIHLSEAFAHGSGVLFILGTLFIPLPEHRKSLGIVALRAFGPGILADGIKLLLPRIRPLHIDHSIDSGFDTFMVFLAIPFQSLDTLDAHAIQSFPSAHTATAIGLAWGLSYFFPRGMPAFFTLAALASFQRFFFGAHWPSDIFASAMLGTLWSFGILSRLARSKHRRSARTRVAEASKTAVFAAGKREGPSEFPNHCEPILE